MEGRIPIANQLASPSVSDKVSQRVGMGSHWLGDIFHKAASSRTNKVKGRNGVKEVVGTGIFMGDTGPTQCPQGGEMEEKPRCRWTISFCPSRVVKTGAVGI